MAAVRRVICRDGEYQPEDVLRKTFCASSNPDHGYYLAQLPSATIRHCADSPPWPSDRGSMFYVVSDEWNHSPSVSRYQKGASWARLHTNESSPPRLQIEEERQCFRSWGFLCIRPGSSLDHGRRSCVRVIKVHFAPPCTAFERCVSSNFPSSCVTNFFHAHACDARSHSNTAMRSRLVPDQEQRPRSHQLQQLDCNMSGWQPVAIQSEVIALFASE